MADKRPPLTPDQIADLREQLIRASNRAQEVRERNARLRRRRERLAR